MKKILLLIVSAFLLVAITNAQNFEWAKGFGGSGTDRVRDITVDNNGNTILTGYYENTVDFDPSANTSNLTSNGGQDIYVAKYNSSGDFVWAKTIGGTGLDEGNAITSDNAGNIYVAGFFSNTADFDPGTGTQNQSSNGGIDIFILKLDASGDYVWAKTIGGTAFEQAIGLTTDDLGNVYATGFFRSTVDFDPGSGIQNLSSQGMANDVFVLKLNTSGNYIWAKKLSGNLDNQGHSIFVDASYNVYTTGMFSSTIDLDPSSGIQNVSSEGQADVFVSKLNASGNYVWGKSFGGAGWDSPSSIAVDASGNVYTTGTFDLTVDFDPGVGVDNITSNGGNYDAFVSKLDANGNYVWAKGFGGSLTDEGQSLKLDATGNVYFSGCFGGTVDFDPSSGTFNLIAQGSQDVFVAKLNSSGNLEWVNGFESSSYETGFIALDASENIYTAGSFQGTADVDPDTTNVFNLTSNGGDDVFILKLSQTPPCANIVNIPDANFKNALLSHSPVIDTDGDGEICESEAQAFTGTLSVNGSGPSTQITDLTGIESFTSITTLRCFNNDLNSLDVTNNTELIELHFGGNNVSSIDLSQNTALQILYCNSNNLSSLDVSNNLALQSLSCYENNLTQINISLNTSIKQFRCYSNILTSLNIANGNNSNFDWMTAGGNPGLSCIQHDTGFDPTTNSNFTKDSTASWSDDCSVVLVNSITVQGANGIDTVEMGNTLQMEAMVLPANADDQTYSWSITVNTGDASINTNGQLIPQAIGNVTVLAAANDGSGVVGSKIITIVPTQTNPNVNIKDLAFENLSIYPNPTNDIINIKVQENLNSIQLFDITGKRIQTFHAQNKQLDVSTIKAGIYFLEIANSKKKSVIKIIKR